MELDSNKISTIGCCEVSSERDKSESSSGWMIVLLDMRKENIYFCYNGTDN